MLKCWIRDIFVCAALLLVGVSASAQGYSYTPIKESAPKIRTEFGAGIGVLYTGFSTISTESVKLQPRFGFEGHLDMALRFGRNFALEAEVGYQGGSIDVSNGREDRRIRSKAIDIPVLLSLRLANNMVRINAGPVFTVMSRGEYTVNEEVMMFGAVNPTWNLAAGVGVCFSHHFLVELRYVHAMKDELNHFEGEEFTTRSYRIAASFTALF